MLQRYVAHAIRSRQKSNCNRILTGRKDIVITSKHCFLILQQTRSYMKNMLLFALLTIVFLFVGCTLKIRQAPKPVRSTFDSMFPGATHVEWEKVMSTYKAEFYHEGHEKEVQFDSDGTWQRTKTELSFFDIPASVLETAREFCQWEIDDISLYEQSKGIPAFYLIEYDRDYAPGEKQLRILPSGTIMAY